MIYSLPELKPGLFLTRKNRFAAEIESDGKIISVHLANSGRMKELLLPGAKVWWHPKTSGKTQGSLWIAEKNGYLVILHAVAANMIFEAAVSQNHLDALKHCRIVKREYTHGNSRFDFLLEDTQSGKKILTEVKSVNLSLNGTGLFPDAPTLRGRKHMEELKEALSEGYESLVVFVGLREDIQQFRPYWETDPDFAKTLKESVQSGIKILAYHSVWSHLGCLKMVQVPAALE